MSQVCPIGNAEECSMRCDGVCLMSMVPCIYNLFDIEEDEADYADD